MGKKTHQNELDSLKTRLARALADYDNLVKRTEREKMDLVRFANQNLAEDLFPVIEMLEKVQKHQPNPAIELAINRLKVVLENAGIVEVKPEPGEEFDPEKHEAVETLGNEEKHGKVAELLSSGYSYNDGKLITPAKVKVYGNSNVQSQMSNVK